jgi:V/A-type H+-transporting ATPase subunit C
MGIGFAHDIDVKCRAMYAKLLDREEYDVLLSKKSVAQIAGYLKKESSYSYVLRFVDENDVHRGQLEHVFKESLFDDYADLGKFTTGSYKAVIRAMFEAHEIDDLKLVISSICSDNEHYLTPEDLIYTHTHGRLAASSLLGAGTMEDLVGYLGNTRYYKPLLPFAVREHPDFIKIDHALNLLNFWTKMNVFNKSLKGAGRKNIVMLFYIRSAIDNILFIYRIKKLYNYRAKEILIYLMPCEYKISNRELLELTECENMEALTDRIAKTNYGFLFPKGRESEWETIHAEYFYQIHKRNIRRQSGDVSTALSYLYLKETDIMNIIMIIEGIRYSLPAEKIAEFLIGYRRAESSKVGDLVLRKG